MWASSFSCASYLIGLTKRFACAPSLDSQLSTNSKTQGFTGRPTAQANSAKESKWGQLTALGEMQCRWGIPPHGSKKNRANTILNKTRKAYEGAYKKHHKGPDPQGKLKQAMELAKAEWAKKMKAPDAPEHPAAVRVAEVHITRCYGHASQGRFTPSAGRPVSPCCVLWACGAVGALRYVVLKSERAFPAQVAVGEWSAEEDVALATEAAECAAEAGW